MATKFFAYISPIWREAPLGGIHMKFCVRGHLADIINRAKFYLNQIRGFDSAGGSNFWLSHKKEKSPLTQGLNCRSACDYICTLIFFAQVLAFTLFVDLHYTYTYFLWLLKALHAGCRFLKDCCDGIFKVLAHGTIDWILETIWLPILQCS